MDCTATLRLFVLGTILVHATGSLAATSIYTYDKLNRLTSAVINGSRIEYVYDAAGNITQVVTPYSIAVSKSGTGLGSVSDDFGKLDCGDDCSGVYDLGAIATLTAVPAPGSSFDGWSGACAGAGTCVLPVTGIHTANASFTMASADLAVTNTDGVATAIPGESVDYTIVVANSGPGTVPDASVTGVFPPETTCTWTSASNGGASGSAGSGTGDILETLVLPTGADVTYTASCEIDPAATGQLSNTASVTTAVSDPNPGNETATDLTDLTPAADHWLSLDAAPTQLGPAQSVTYTAQTGNLGPSRAVSVGVQHVLPTGASFVSFNAPDWACVESGGTVSCSMTALDPAQTSTIEVTATMPATAGLHSSVATISSATPEHAPGDETDGVDVEVFGPPTIVSVDSVSDTEDGSLLPGTSTMASLTQIHLEADHALSDPGGDTDPNDVTNPDCYRLFRADPSGVFGSTTCGDPSDVPIDWIGYEDAGPFTVALRLNTGVPLEAGLYRLVVCASGSEFLMDDFGSALDGDGDGNCGDDFVLDFGVRVTNLLVNPNFDDDLTGWSVSSQTAGEVIHDGATDAGDAQTSGSASLTNLTGAGSVLDISQCVQVAEGAAYVVTGDLSAESSGVAFPEVRAYVELFDNPTCAGIAVNSWDLGGIIGTTSGAWLPAWGGVAAAPTGTLSARVTFQVTGDEHSAQAWLDDLQLYFGGIYIFIDGFESGNTTPWDSP